jgi:BURP domain
LVGADETKVRALAVCHLDVDEFFLEAEKLGAKPGSGPVCHFLPQDDLLWAKV